MVAGARAGTFSPHCARVQPAKLVQGLAAAVERLGVAIYEQSEVVEIAPRLARTRRGSVRAPIILRCLEGFTAGLKGQRRSWLPMNSSMIVTDPLPESVMAEIGWSEAELLGDAAHAYMYAQRTADNRIALGGRGVPYRFGSRTDDRGATQETTIASLTALLREMFPAAAGVPIAHAWCGVLGVPRDWCATVTLDRDTGLGTAGGYVGSGLTTTNLAGRTLSDLVLGQDTELTHLPWVNRRVRPLGAGTAAVARRARHVHPVPRGRPPGDEARPRPYEPDRPLRQLDHRPLSRDGRRHPPVCLLPFGTCAPARRGAHVPNGRTRSRRNR